jgi:DNA-binding response OmpR family regulator
MKGQFSRLSYLPKGTEVRNLTESKPRITILEDDENIRKTVSDILQQKGYKKDTAQNGKEAENKTRSNFYNLALLNIKLPDMEGN